MSEVTYKRSHERSYSHRDDGGDDVEVGDQHANQRYEAG